MIQSDRVIDAELPFDQITLDLARQIERLSPFGEGNPAVTLATRSVSVEHDRTFGRKGEHREVTLADESGHTQKIIWWRGAETDLPAGRFDIAYSIKSTSFQGTPELSIEWIDFQIAAASAIEVTAPMVGLEVIDWDALDVAAIPDRWRSIR